LKKASFFLWSFSVLFDGFGTVVAFLFYVLPYLTLKHIIDRFTKDGDAQPFTPAFNTKLHPIFGLVFLIGVLMSILLIWKNRQIEAGFEKVLRWLSRRFHHLIRDCWNFVNEIWSIKLAKWEVALIPVFTLFAIWLRLYKINQKMDYDEAYTYIAFASKSIWTILSDYHLPNNHIFHTLLVHIAIQITGSGQPWSVRIPAYIAGVLIVPTIYLLARQLYNRPIAILATCLVVINPFLIQYSTNARGYSLLALITILTFGLGSYLLHRKNWFAWMLFSVLCALGFFTVPVMLYPYGCLIIWLFFSSLTGDLGPEYASRKVFWIYLFATSVLTGLLTLLFYAPILQQAAGPRLLFANPFVEALPWDQFLIRIRNDLLDTWNNNWFVNLSVWVRAGLGLACLSSIFLHRKISAYKIPTQVVAFAWISLALVAQRPATYPRTWVFLLPLFLMWSAAGLVGIVQRIHLPAAVKIQPAGILSLAAVGGLSLFILYQSVVTPIPLQLDTGDARSTIEHLQSTLQPGDMIVIAFPADAPVQYYAQISGIPQSYFYLPKQGDRSFTRAFLIVSPNYDQTIESVLKARNLDASRFDLADRQTESDFGIYTVYRVYPSVK
jgi:hypothetical protein